jgi:hypothetical protein
VKVPKEVRPLVQAAREAGWGERESRHGLVLYPPEGRPIAIHRSVRPGRTLANMRAVLRARGLDV